MDGIAHLELVDPDNTRCESATIKLGMRLTRRIPKLVTIAKHNFDSD